MVIPIRDINPSRKFPFITISIIAINISIFVLSLFDGEKVLKYALQPNMFHEKPFTLITHMFLHGNIPHIAGNMLYLWVFGDNVESKLGHIKFLLFYIFCGIIGATLHLSFNLKSSIPMVGASGAISGVLGAYMVFFPWARIKSIVFFLFYFGFAYIYAYYFIAFWFIWQFIGLLLPSNVAYLAHIGGFIAGFLTAKIKNKINRRKIRRIRRIYVH